MSKILVLIGSQGLGDILCSIPTIRKLYEVYQQKIHVFTYNTELLKNYPYIILSDNYNTEEGDIFIETFRPDKFTHSRTDIRQLHAISSGFQLLPDEMTIDFYPDKQEYINLPKNYVVIHPSKSWPSRSWEKDRWQELIDRLNVIGIPVILIGKDSSEVGTYLIQKPIYELKIKLGVNLINKIDIHQTWHIINNASKIITMDSGILHFAGTTDTHIIQLGSSIDPRLRAPYRNGTQTYKYSYILGECKIFCASNMRYNVQHNGKHSLMAPVPFCLERGESINQDIEPDPNIYLCHPTVEQVYQEVIKDYNFPNKGQIIL